MKFKGIIPEVKMSESIFSVSEILDRLEPYDIVSVNTSSLFDGSLMLLKCIRSKCPKKFLIRKDFIMIPRQIKESKEAGADAVLIIREFLTEIQYIKLLEECEKNKIIPITEIVKLIEHLQEPILVNSRDLNDEIIWRKHADALCLALKDKYKNVIYASGENSDRVIKEGIADAVLIGTAFVQDKIKGAKDVSKGGKE